MSFESEIAVTCTSEEWNQLISGLQRYMPCTSGGAPEGFGYEQIKPSGQILFYLRTTKARDTLQGLLHHHKLAYTENVKTEPAYHKTHLRNFAYWGLFLHTRQHPFIGRAYAWALDEKSENITDMTKHMRDELFDDVIPRWRSAIQPLFNPTDINLGCLGNKTHHLHWHLVPRYNKPVLYEGTHYTDPDPTTSWNKTSQQEIVDSVLEKLVSDIKKNL